MGAKSIPTINLKLQRQFNLNETKIINHNMECLQTIKGVSLLFTIT